MKKIAAICGLVAVAGWYALLPPPPARAGGEGAEQPSDVRGVIHVHTNRSDGTGSVERVAVAAARAGLQFVILTDHGDGTRPPDPPVYRSGVLCIDGVEVSTDGGHIVAVGQGVSPYPLGGGAREVVEDLRRLGALTFAAHPGSEKPDLRWTGWDVAVDGLEWLNGDSEWRDESAWSLVRVLMTYPARHEAALAMLLDRPAAVMARWDELARQRAVVGIAGADAHARIVLPSIGEPYDSRASLRSPSYEAMFRTFSSALSGIRLTGDATRDAAEVMAALRQGRTYSVVDVLGSPAWLRFTAAAGATHVSMGETLEPDGPVAVRVEVPAAVRARIALLKDGEEISSTGGSRLDYTAAPGPGVYRVEVTVPGAPGAPPIPWMVSNPIYVRAGRASSTSGAAVTSAREVVRYEEGAADGWAIEASAESRGAIDVVSTRDSSDQILFRYALGGLPSASPFVAAVMPAGSELAGTGRLTFVARASRPMRASIQLRVPGRDGRAEERWHKSVYLDTTPRDVVIPFSELTPRGPGASELPLADVESVLFVVDTVNTAVGTNGQLWLDRVRYMK